MTQATRGTEAQYSQRSTVNDKTKLVQNNNPHSARNPNRRRNSSLWLDGGAYRQSSIFLRRRSADESSLIRSGDSYNIARSFCLVSNPKATARAKNTPNA